MLESIIGQVRYLNPEWKGRTDRPSIGDRESRRNNTTKRDVPIHDARGADLDLDVAGFLLAPHDSAVRNFHDEAEVAEAYYAEMVALIKRLTGADEVRIFQHVVRTEDSTDFNKAYARFVHCDYSISNPRENATSAFEHRDVALDPAKNWEFAYYNTWKPIEREVQQNPLAMIDASSLDDGDVVDYYYTGFGEKALTSMPVASSEHEFYYFPEMQPNEILVIKQLDTRPGRAMTCPHTSFNLDAPQNALGRRSIEVRLMCAFAD